MVTPRKPVQRDVLRTSIVALLEAGLATQAEAAELSGVSRQLVKYWSRHVDPVTSRRLFLEKAWHELSNRLPKA